MRSASLSLSVLALTCLLGCPDDPGDTATTSLTTNTTTNSETGDGDGDSGDGDGDSGDGDGDGDPGDGDGDSGDGDGFCVHQCMVDDDCLIDGADQGYTCVDSLCTTGISSGCTTDEECVPLFSGWVMPCVSNADCPGQVCIDQGLCATIPNDFIDCATLLMDELMTTDIEGNSVTVCAQLGAACHDDGFCYVPCQSNDDCLSDAYPNCNVDTGVCECGSDNDCATLGPPNVSVCTAGICGCGEDQQCIDASLGDVCTSAGFCGCSGDMACSGNDNPFDGGSFACVQG